MKDNQGIAKTLDPATANAVSTAANQKALGKVRARVIEIDTKKQIGDTNEEPGKTTALPDDPFTELVHKGKIIEPPFDMLTLSMLPEHNTTMNQCVEAMEINIEGFGHRFIPRIKTDHKGVDGDTKAAVDAEKVRLENFFMYATRESFTKFRRKLRRDLETTGCAYYEVIRGDNNVIQGFTHLPSYQMRLSRMEDDLRMVDRPILKLNNDGSVTVEKVKEWRRFRMYVQSKSIRRRNLEVVQGHRVRWFKEFGDPQIYNNETGEKANEKLPVEKRANEVVYLSIYSSRGPYGLPRYIGNLLSIFGDRAAEEINFITFRNNNIPSMVVAVSNGQLTEGTINRVQSFVESQIQGSDNYSKFLIIEAETTEEGEDGGQVKLDIKPLVKEQHKDALFQNYSSNNKDNVRQAWRLPPIFIGRTDVYTRTTAETSRQLADEQVFAPERDEFDLMMNREIFPCMDVVYHKFKSNSPNTTDNQELIKYWLAERKQVA